MVILKGYDEWLDNHGNPGMDTWTEADEINADEVALYMGPESNDEEAEEDDCGDQDSGSEWP